MSSIITFSKAMPLRMVFTQLEGLNTDNPENKLFKNSGHPYFDAGEYLQPFQKTDQVVFQFKSSFDDNELKLYDYSDDSEIATILLDEFAFSGYSIFEKLIDLSGLDEGAYYLIATGSHSDAKTYAARSEPIYVKTSHTGSFLIKYANNEDYAEFDYLSEYDNHIRVHGQFIKPVNQNENEVTRDSGGTGITISDITYEGKSLEVFKAAHWMIEKINIILGHDAVEISGLEVTPESKLEYDFGFQSLISSPSVDVPLKESNVKNVHDSGSRSQRLARATDLVVTADYDNIQIEYTSNSGGDEDGFDLEASDDGLTGWSVVDSVADTVETTNHTGILWDETRYYRVVVKLGTLRAASEVVEGTTLTLNAPSDIILTPDLEEAQADWTSNSGGNEDSFTLEFSLDGSSGWTTVETVGTGVVTSTHTGRNHDTNYYYRVKATKDAKDTPYSSVVMTTTLLMAAPSDLAATNPVYYRNSLTWTSNSGGQETSFEIERSPASAGTWVQIATVGTGVTSYDDDTVESITSYDYRVRAYRTLGQSDYSNTENITTSTSEVVLLDSNDDILLDSNDDELENKAD